MSFIPTIINSEYFSYERLVDNNNECCLQRFAAIHGETGITNYFRTQAIKWGFYSVEDELFNKNINKTWQNEYSKDCIFMYKPVAEIE